MHKFRVFVLIIIMFFLKIKNKINNNFQLLKLPNIKFVLLKISLAMSSYRQYAWLAFKRSKLEHRFLSDSLKSYSNFRRDTLFIFLFLYAYHNLSLDIYYILLNLFYFLMFFIMSYMEKTIKYHEKNFFIIILIIINLLISKEISMQSLNSNIVLQIWLIFFTFFTQKTCKFYLFYAFSSYLLLNLTANGLDYNNIIILLQYTPFSLFFVFSFEKNSRAYWLQREKEANNLKSRAFITDILISPIFIITRNSQILFANMSAKEILDQIPNKNALIAIISDKYYGIFEETVNNLEINEPTISKRIELKNKQQFEISFRSIIWDNFPAILLVLNNNKSETSMLKNFSIINKSLSKMTTNLLENMETDYNKWSNLQSLKYIKQSDMKLLASCIMEANFLKCLIHANLDKTKILLSEPKKKEQVFHIRNTMLQILEIISVMATSKHQETLLKFEESFPEKVNGDYWRFKQSFLIIWRQISMNYQQAVFEMHCHLKEFHKNQFVLVFKIILPPNENFACLIKQVCEDNAPLSFNILNQTYSSFDLLMLKPVISIISGLISFQQETNSLLIEIPFEPAGEFEQNQQVINLKNPFSLTFCRTSTDRNSYKWKEVQFVVEKPRLIPLTGAPKFKKINLIKGEIPKISSINSNINNNNVASSLDNYDGPFEPAHIIHHSSKDISEKASSKEESPEIENNIKNRKKTHSCFLREGLGSAGSAGSNGSTGLCEESKQNDQSEFMTPYHNLNDQRIKAIIQEDLKDLEGTPIVKKISEFCEGKGFEGMIKDFDKENTPSHFHDRCQENGENEKNMNKFMNKFYKENSQCDRSPINRLLNNNSEKFQENHKRPCFDRGIYETLFNCWKSHEKSLKVTIMATIYKILETNKEGLNIKFSKNKAKNSLKKRQNSLPLLNNPYSFSLNSRYSKTPQWSSSRFKKKIKINGKQKNFLDEKKMGFSDYQQEKIQFLGSRMVLSPRPLVKKTGNYFISPQRSHQVIKNNYIINEIMKKKLVTQRRKWIS